MAEYIKKRGRIAIAELAAKSNTFIDLEAKATAVSPLACTIYNVTYPHTNLLLPVFALLCQRKQTLMLQVSTFYTTVH